MLSRTHLLRVGGEELVLGREVHGEVLHQGLANVGAALVRNLLHALDKDKRRRQSHRLHRAQRNLGRLGRRLVAPHHKHHRVARLHTQPPSTL
jgi:hypothetical protein